jgi:hypothetical protein
MEHKCNDAVRHVLALRESVVRFLAKASNAFFFVAYQSLVAAVAFRVALITVAFVLAFGAAARAQAALQNHAMCQDRMFR